MKQILQSLQTGKTELIEVPVPKVSPGHLLIETSYTLVSSGTERMLIDFGKAGLVQKARQQPDKVRMVLEKMKVDGFQPTIEAVLNKLQEPLPLGYCNVGRVVEVGAGENGFSRGDRVISNGYHAEFVRVPLNLCAKVPDTVPDEAAAFTVLGAIALQGIRLANPTLGECVVVMGLGLIGLMTVQLLRAHGCRVLGVDFDEKKLELARQFGAEVVNLSKNQDPIEFAKHFSRGRGVDAVIITASTNSNLPVHQAAVMSRKRGRIILVGVVGLELSREDFFKKELTFQVSASYGPGRYDKNYEENGQDYPIGYVRWTEQRNFEAVLDMMVDGRLNVEPLISHRFLIDEANKAYELVSSSTEKSLGILLRYPRKNISEDSRVVSLADKKNVVNRTSSRPIISFIGAGNYAAGVLMPAFKAASAQLQCVVSSGGISGVYAARKFGFNETSTNVNHIFSDSITDGIVVATRHDNHATFVLKALESGKHVFVEKPLCLNLDELNRISQFSKNSNSMIMVGFNRRFAPQVQKIKSLLDSVTGPKSFVMTVNAGAISPEHWTQDVRVGGGRIIGEVCHFVDLLRFLAGVSITDWTRATLDDPLADTVSITIHFADGSIGTIHYFSNGNKGFPKERLEVFTNGKILQLDNYRKLKGFGWPNFKKMNLFRQDKGQKKCVEAFLSAIANNSAPPISIEELLEVGRVVIEISG